MSEQRADGLLPVAEAVNSELPWLWWARTGSSRLAGMTAPPEGFPFSFLQECGFDTIVDRKSTRLNSSHCVTSRMPSSA